MDIGEIIKTIEFEPVEDTPAPVEEPVTIPQEEPVSVNSN